MALGGGRRCPPPALGPQVLDPPGREAERRGDGDEDAETGQRGRADGDGHRRTEWRISVRRQQGYQTKFLTDTLLPIIGFLFCLLIWVNLNIIAKTVGGIWFAIGILYVGYKTNWFRSAPVMIDFSDQ